MTAKSELIGENVVLRGDVERLQERCRIKDAEIDGLRAWQSARLEQHDMMEAENARLRASLNDAIIYIGECDPEFSTALQRKAGISSQQSTPRSET